MPVRGSPYSASFNQKTPASANNLTGSAMTKHIPHSMERLSTFMKETLQGSLIKDKDLTDTKVLISVKDNVELVSAENDRIMLQLDQVDESLKLLQKHSLAKDSQIKQMKKLFDEWTSLKKVAKDMKKEISPLVATETQKNTSAIGKLEEDLKIYASDLKKRDFYQYNCGAEQAHEKLNDVFGEINQFEEKISTYGYNAKKFGNPDLINTPVKQVENIKIENKNMKMLWEHIDMCQKSFQTYMDNTWEKTQPFELEDEVKKFLQTLKGMKVEKKCNAYQGILEEIKKWQIFLPLIGDLRNDAMRDRHW